MVVQWKVNEIDTCWPQSGPPRWSVGLKEVDWHHEGERRDDPEPKTGKSVECRCKKKFSDLQPGQDSQNFLRQLCKLFVTLDLDIIRNVFFFWSKYH
jgi:hypothetical protein